jgi:hypothetical protein
LKVEDAEAFVALVDAAGVVDGHRRLDRTGKGNLHPVNMPATEAHMERRRQFAIAPLRTADRRDPLKTGNAAADAGVKLAIAAHHIEAEVIQTAAARRTMCQYLRTQAMTFSIATV